MKATLHGILSDDGGMLCTCWFQWGTEGYSNETPPTSGLTTGATFSSVISIVSGQFYHFRTVARNARGTVYGSDQIIVAPTNPNIMCLVDAQMLKLLGV